MKDLTVITDYPSMDIDNTWQYLILGDGSTYMVRFVTMIDTAADLKKLDDFEELVKKGDLVLLQKESTFILHFLKEVKLSTWRTESQMAKEFEIPQICDGTCISIDVYRNDRKKGYHYHGALYHFEKLKEVSYLQSLIYYLHGLRLHGMPSDGGR
jgi:hypothetical protein